MSPSRRRLGFVICFVSAIALCSIAQAALIDGQISLQADSSRVLSDDAAGVVITIEVFDAAGRPAPDGTTVNLVTTLGEIVSPVQTLGGIAQTVLRSGGTSGTALVSAMVGTARATVEIEFTAGAGSASPGSPMVELTAGELSYSTERRLFVAGPGARLSYQSIEITADAMEYDVMSNVLRANGSVVLKSGAEEVSADAAFYELTSLRGRLLRLSDPPERLLVEGEKLRTRPDTSDDTELWFRGPRESDEVRSWLKARSAIIHPRERVILDHAEFYVDDMRVMGFSRQVFDPRRGFAPFGNSFGYSSLSGTDLDVPYYYHASENRIGSLHLTRNQTVGGLTATRRWALGIKEEYFRYGRGQGSLSIDDITRPLNGIDWQHQFALTGKSTLSLDAGITKFEADGSQLRSAGLTYYRPLSSGRLSLTMSGSQFGGSQHSFGSLSYRLKSSALGSGVVVTPVVSLRHSRRHDDTTETLFDPETGEILQLIEGTSGVTTSPGVDVDIGFPRHRIGPKTELNVNMHSGYAWGLAGGARPVFDGRLGLSHRLGVRDYVKLDYIYSGAPSSLQPSLFTVGRQRLSLTGLLQPRSTQIRFNTSYEIGGDRFFGYLSAVQPLPWGRSAGSLPVWTLQATHIFSCVSDYNMASSVLALVRRVGQYNLSLCYSPQGQGMLASQPWISLDGYGYTYSGGRHVWLEFTSSGF